MFQQPRWGVGTYVTDVGEYGREAWAVMTPTDVALSVHPDIYVALRRARWHSGTRFVYVSVPDLCWDGVLEGFVSWDAALTSIRETLNRKKNHA